VDPSEERRAQRQADWPAARTFASAAALASSGILAFDDGWHKLATALWLFGPVRAMDMYLRSDYHTNDEHWEITDSKGYARVNRCTGRGIQQPSLEVYATG
jgi:predicted dehydrogenase